MTSDPRWQQRSRSARHRRPRPRADRPLAAGHLRASVTKPGRRLTRVISYLRDDPEDNGYAHPIEGVAGYVDLATREVVEFEDGGVVPIPPERPNYYPEDVGALRTDLASRSRSPSPTARASPSRATSSGGSAGSSVCRCTPIEGLVLHEIALRRSGDRRLRPILHRAVGCPRWSCRTARTDPAQRWKNAFDAGEWGLGRFVNSLELGCDCLGEIHYFDAVVADEHGDASTRHERDLHARGGLRRSSGSTRTCTRSAPRSAVSVGWSSARSTRSATTSTASTGTSTSTARSSSR